MKRFNCAEIEEKIGYKFKNKSLLKQAFTRESYCNELHAVGVNAQSNEVLEFCGDSVLGASVITILMEKYSAIGSDGMKSKLDEGDFSNIKSRLSDKRMLSERIYELGLYEYLLLNKGDEKMNIATQPSVMEDLFESIVGAIYFDSNKDMSLVISIINRMLDVERYLEGNDVQALKSSKNVLQEWCQDRHMQRPVYDVVSESGPEHQKSYTVLCSIEGRAYASGIGKNKKAAESDAAEKTYKMLMGMSDAVTKDEK